MIEIKEKSRDFNKLETYLLTMGNNSISVKDVPDGTPITVSGYCIFSDDDKDDATELLSVLTPDNEVYTCQSSTFRKSLIDMYTTLEVETLPIIKTSGKSKAGREFVDCMLDVSKFEI